MSPKLHPDMIEATRLARSGRLAEATSLLQRLLGSCNPSGGGAGTAPGLGRGAIILPAPTPAAGPPETATGDRPGDTAAEGERFVSGSFTGPAGTRAYKLYIPPTRRREPAPLLVMLHGCSQSPDDFAAGTRMNELAGAQGWLVVWPAQSGSANIQRCWNWFSPNDQQRDQGEPSLIAGITREVMRTHAVDPGRVYVAGLSAGGAAAAIMADAYPDLYAAVGVHSGLACGAAHDLSSAFAAMRQGAAAAKRDRPDGQFRRIVPTIVFHSDRDDTVHHRNGDHVIVQSGAAGLRAETRRGQVPDGHAYSRTLHTDGSGTVRLEQWVVHGGGHAWSGGSRSGSFTDPAGPDASGEMLRFFGEHVHEFATQHA